MDLPYFDEDNFASIVKLSTTALANPLSEMSKYTE